MSSSASWGVGAAFAAALLFLPVVAPAATVDPLATDCSIHLHIDSVDHLHAHLTATSDCTCGDPFSWAVLTTANGDRISVFAEGDHSEEAMLTRGKSGQPSTIVAARKCGEVEAVTVHWPAIQPKRPKSKSRTHECDPNIPRECDPNRP